MSKSRTEIDKEIMYRKIMPSASKRDAKTAQADTGNSGAGQSDTAPFDRVIWRRRSHGYAGLISAFGCCYGKDP